MAQIGYKRGIADPKTYIDTERFKGGYMMLERVEQLSFERFDPNTDFKLWERGRIFTKDDEIKWLKRADGLHIVMISENNLPTDFHPFPHDLHQVSDGNGRRVDRRVYLWGERVSNSQEWYELRIPEVLNYPLDVAQNGAKRLCLKIRDYEVEERDPEGRPFVSIIHRYVGLEEG
jgi:hypothetical protein